MQWPVEASEQSLDSQIQWKLEEKFIVDTVFTTNRPYMMRRLPDVSLSGQAVQGDMAEAFFMSYRALLSQIKLLTIC